MGMLSDKLKKMKVDPEDGPLLVSNAGVVVVDAKVDYDIPRGADIGKEMVPAVLFKADARQCT